MGEEGWKIRRTDDPDVCFVSNPVQLWANGIVEFRVDRRNDKCLITPIMRDKTEGAVLDLTESLERSRRERAISRDEFRCYDPVVLKKVAQIVERVDAVFLLALESAVDVASRECRFAEMESQIMALANECGDDVVAAALHDVRLIRRETFEKAFGEHRNSGPPT